MTTSINIQTNIQTNIPMDTHTANTMDIEENISPSVSVKELVKAIEGGKETSDVTENTDGVSSASASIERDDHVFIAPKITLKEAKASTKQAAKEIKLQEKESSKQAKLQEKEQAKQANIAEKKAAKQAELQEKEQAKQQAKLEAKEKSKLNREKKKKEQELSDEEFDIKFKALTYVDKEKIIRANLPGLMRIVENQDEAIKEIISTTNKKEWKKMFTMMETNKPSSSL